MRIDLLFSSHNGGHTLPRMLEALCTIERPPGWRIVAVDNASTDATREILRGFASRLPLTILEEPRRGKNVALNRALEACDGELVVFTDDDILPDRDWLTRLVECAQDQPGYDVFGGRILPEWPRPPDPLILRHAPLGVTYAITPEAQRPGPVDPGLVWGPNMAVRRRVFEAGHRFLESMGPASGNYIMGSETEFTLRVAAAGHPSWYCDRARVRHMIRPHQLEPDWVVRRAYRFGRNQWVQEHHSQTPPEWPRIAGLPRWRIHRLLQESLRLLRARVTNDRERLFLARWELHFLRGYLRQGWLERRGGKGHV